MRAIVSRFFSKLAWTLSASALAGGLIIWLAGNGLDVRESVASVLKTAQAPENLPFALATILVVVVLAGLSLPFILRKFNRPPLPTASQLRSALANLQEHTLDAIPNSENADAALRRLSLLLHDLEPYGDIAGRVKDLLDLSQRYLFEVMPGGDEDRAMALHERALDVLEGLMGTTSWAAHSHEDS